MYDVILQVPIIDMPWEDFLLLAITALAGGAFGAAIGALPAFIFTGFVVFLGEGLAILERSVGGALGAVNPTDVATGVTGVIGFGPITGPHIAFAGGVAATAYAGRKYPEMEPDGWDYHFGKNILYAFGTKPDILAVGAVFGVLGMLLVRIGNGLSMPFDTIAFTVFFTAFLARPAFGYPVVGSAGGSGYFDMTPFEREEERGDGSGRLAVEPWLPQQYTWSGVTAIGLVGGALGGWTWIMTGSIFMAYGISAASLLFLNLGVENFPVTHHITLGGSTFAVVAAGGTGSELVVMLAAIFGGVVGALLGEVTQRIAYAHSGTHVDPPAISIFLYTVAIGVLYLLDILPNSGYLGL